ncbi:hypothetical protein PInf_010130 [Phytophthora infestans]|nr:hypothetical protein PInf_010130 [Phytophthora infestans]
MELVTKVRDAEHWVQVLESSEKKLVVVDVHKDWCGPCKIVEPSYKRLTTDIEHAERRVMFATLNGWTSRRWYRGHWQLQASVPPF